MIDLHTHSRASDGSLNPDELIRKAARQGLRAIALTDHDTVKGLDRAKDEARRQGILFIPGIEIEIERRASGEFHLLGLGIGRPSPAFLEAVAELSRRRELRNREILDRMNEMSIDVTWEELLALARGDGTGGDGAPGGKAGTSEDAGQSLGRPHFAALLVKRKVVKNHEQAFVRYLGEGKPFYVPKAGLEFERTAALIRESGGIPVLAHPMSLHVAWGRMPLLLRELKDQGLAGIEAWHPTAKLRECRRLEDLAKETGLCVTAGSDFHGEVRPDRRLGYTCGGREIEDKFLENIPVS
ncbi:MAG: PHP domain-containing protein [Treponema sp.]|jgi:predicted metal-dependent phosphoesterase TrpH|nr:PHP domain-containing protein [Treponema sp.]